MATPLIGSGRMAQVRIGITAPVAPLCLRVLWCVCATTVREWARPIDALRAGESFGGLSRVSFSRLPLFLAGLLAVTACAPQLPPAASTSTIGVSNTFGVECDLLLGTQTAAWVPASTKLLVRWLPEVPFDIRWRCGSESGTASIQENGQWLLLNPSSGAGADPVADHTASLAVSNPTPSDFHVALDGQDLGMALANSQSLFRDLPTGPHSMEFRPQQAGVTQAMQIQLDSGQTLQAAVPPCEGTVRVLNSPSATIQAELGGVVADMLPNAEFSFSGVPAGQRTLVIRTSASQSPLSLSFVLECQETKEVRLTAESANLVLENRLGETVHFSLPGKDPIKVESGQSHEWTGLMPGPQRCEAKTENGRLFARELVLVASGTLTWVLDAPLAELEITNLVGERIVILRGDVPLAELDPGNSALLPVQPGPLSLSAWCPVTGHTQPLTVEVAKGERLPVRIGPQGGRIKLENTTNEGMWVYRNGHFLGIVPANMTVEFSGQPLGKNLVELSSPDGRPLAKRALDTQTAEPSAQAVPVARDLLDVTLSNQTGEALRLEPSAAGNPTSVAPGVRLLIQIPAADPQVRAVGVTTGLGYSARVSTQPDATREIVLRSQVGGVRVENRLTNPVEIWIDGKKVKELAAGESAEFTQLAPGRHLLAARSPKQPNALEQIAFNLAPNGYFQWSVQSTPSTLVLRNTTGEPVRLKQDQQTAGRLENGTQGPLTPSAQAIRLEAEGEKSGQTLRLFLPAGSAQTKLVTGENLGVVALWGLAGRKATIEWDESSWSVEPDAAEPFRFATSPGEKRLKVRFDDGTVVERLVRVTPGMEVAVRAQPKAVSLSIRNDTGNPVEIWVAESLVSQLEPGQSTLIALPTEPEPAPVQARSTVGNRAWLLTGVALPDFGKFQLILSE